MASLDKSGYSLKFDWHFFKYGIPNFLGVLLNANQLAKCLDIVDGHEHLSVDISVPYLLDILHVFYVGTLSQAPISWREGDWEGNFAFCDSL